MSAEAAPRFSGPDLPPDDGRPSTEIAVPARDGGLLEGTLFRPRGAARPPAVVIGCAMGVRRGFYARFALFLRQQGFLVLTFDYRGIGGSAGPPGAAPPALHDWGERDLAGAIDWLAAASGGPVALVGHSVAGQLLGLAADSDRLAAIVLVAPQSGQWRLWRGFGRARVAWFWFVGIPLVTRLFGRLPGWSYGGADLPAGVAREWARWGRHRDYVLGHAPDVRANFAGIRAPLLAYGVADDALAPPAAVDAIVSWFQGAAVERRTVAADGPAADAPVGHFGFFDRRFASSLWRETADWLGRAVPGD